MEIWGQRGASRSVREIWGDAGPPRVTLRQSARDGGGSNGTNILEGLQAFISTCPPSSALQTSQRAAGGGRRHPDISLGRAPRISGGPRRHPEKHRGFLSDVRPSCAPNTPGGGTRGPQTLGLFPGGPQPRGWAGFASCPRRTPCNPDSGFFLRSEGTPPCRRVCAWERFFWERTLPAAGGGPWGTFRGGGGRAIGREIGGRWLTKHQVPERGAPGAISAQKR